MSKRGATSELNHDNWDAKDDDDEEPGVFVPLKASELKNRVIKKAKRSLTTSASPAATAASSPFAKFSGFSSTATSSTLFSTTNQTNSPFSAATSTKETAPQSPFATSTKEIASQSPFATSQEKTNNASGFSMTFKKESEDTPNGKTEDSANFKNIGEDTKKSTSISAAGESAQEKLSRGIEYCKQLKSLNESVLKWIQLHLDKNVCSDFTPVFADYKKHLDTLNMKYPARRNESQQLTSVVKKPSPPTDNSSSTAQTNFPKETKQQQDETDYGAHFTSNTTNTSTFSFGMKLTPTASSSNSPLGPSSSSKEGALKGIKEESKPQFSTGFFGTSNKEENKGTGFFGTSNKEDNKGIGFFGTSNKEENKGTGFFGTSNKEESKPQFSAGFFSQNKTGEDKSSNQFSAGFFSKGLQSGGADKPFSFATAPVERSAEGDQEEEYVPPKNDFVAVSEEDAVYSKRCKLFFKKDDSFADKGVGTLYVKSLEETTQLLIRADTSLGNILLNIRLSASLPISKNGKNNVMICCIPNPPADAKNPDKAIPILIRVKTSEDADELLETLNKYKS